MTSKHLFQLSVLIAVLFNTVRAVQVVQAKLLAQSQGPVHGNTAPVIHDSIYWDTTYNRKVGSVAAISIPAFTTTPFPTDAPALSSTTPIVQTPLPILTEPKSVFQGPDAAIVPILLYHRIDVSSTDSQYYVSPDKFEEQMKLLQNWGYTTITTDLLVKSIADGADLPLHPIIITFDDGHLNNYTTAFPIMQKYGFTGVVYIIGDYMGTSEYMNAEQIKEMSKEGWEVGSHSLTHPDLTSLDPQQQQYEIVESRRFLETELGLPILTFAYPFGENNIAVVNMVYSAGYIAGMGLGYTHNQTALNLYTLQRRDVNGKRDLNSFASFLPWQGDSVYLPVETPAPSLSNLPSQ